MYFLPALSLLSKVGIPVPSLGDIVLPEGNRVRSTSVALHSQEVILPRNAQWGRLQMGGAAFWVIVVTRLLLLSGTSWQLGMLKVLLSEEFSLHKTPEVSPLRVTGLVSSLRRRRPRLQDFANLPGAL